VTTAALADVVDFLARHPPFDALDTSELERVARTAEVEFHPAGTIVFSQGAEPVHHLRVVRSGAVELVDDTRVLDLLGEGELFGQASMLSGLPTGFAVRAAEDTLCYRIPEEAARDLLARPESLRFVARSLLGRPVSREREDAARDPAHLPVASLMRSELVLCPPDISIREAARRMTAVGATSAVIDLGATLGIMTDRDLRSRVLADGLSADASVSAAMTAPAYTVPPERLGSEALLDMLDRGLRHFPVVSPTGRVLGVVEANDLVAVETHSSFHLRRAIARAQSVDELVRAAAGVRPTVLALHDAGIAALNIGAIFSVVVDVLTRRLIELAVAAAGPEPAPFAWLALGSQARREATPSSDVDSALVWYGGENAATPSASDDEIRAYLLGVGRAVVDGLAACGLRSDEKGATAADPLLIRSSDSWRRAARSWLDDPTQEQALILVSVVVDSRPVWGISSGPPIAETFREATARPALLRQLARLALSYRPPTGFMRGLVVEHSGEHRGRLDLKHGGLVPIVDLARWAGMAAGVTSASTSARLRAAAEHRTLSDSDARTLQDAFELITSLRLEHQAAQLRAGVEPDDFADPAALSALTRTYLKEAFRAVASVQKRVFNELQFGVH
jgi:CBS domain-containing protein